MLSERVIIIGNGFDLDLGLKTSFKDFFNSDDSPFDKSTTSESPLAHFINKQVNINSWYDLENIIHSYADKDNNQTLRTSSKKFISAKQAFIADIKFFNKLKKSLENYINAQLKSPINKKSCAAIVLENLIKYAFNDTYLTFNYTDLNIFAQQICNKTIEFDYVHGACNTSSSIIGISDSYKVKDNYEFLYKTSSPNYKSVNVRYALQRAKEIIFFGHSLGKQDYHYFQDFFKKQCRDDMQEDDLCKITFFTKDEDARLKLLSQLRAMNDGRINYLYDCNKLQFITTSEYNQDLLQFINDDSI